MTDYADAGLPPEEIEEINAHGPYDHAVWAGRGLRVTHEGPLSGRGEFLVARIRESLLRHFSREELAAASIVDVGCYDGWILEQLSDLPFERMVGVEPREKNIEKGHAVRGILQIPSRVEYRIGDVDSLGEERFDIVLCTGLLHHLESPLAAMRRLRSACRRLLFLETVCLSSQHMTRRLRREIEMKDVVYLYRNGACGITGQKFESSYYDGSTDRLSVVSVPSLESLLMYLDVCGFTDARVVAHPRTYRRAVWRNRRPMNAVCVSAIVDAASAPPDSSEQSWITDYEGGLMRTVVPRRLLAPLYERFCLGRRVPTLRPSHLLLAAYLLAPQAVAARLRALVALRARDPYLHEILKNLRFNPADKLRLEYGKVLYREGDFEGAVRVMKEVTQRVNADWRAAYRSMFLLSRAYAHLREEVEAKRYEDLCRSCNPRFPLDALRESA